jgi:hypothetical protein
MIESVQALVADQIDRSAMAAIAARGSTTRDELLSTKGHATVSSTSCLDMNDGFIDKGHISRGA